MARFANVRMAMTKRDDVHPREPGAEGKHDGRESPDPRNLPCEFADDMRVNRFTPPPEPPEGDEDLLIAR